MEANVNEMYIDYERLKNILTLVERERITLELKELELIDDTINGENNNNLSRVSTSNHKIPSSPHPSHFIDDDDNYIERNSILSKLSWRFTTVVNKSKLSFKPTINYDRKINSYEVLFDQVNEEERKFFLDLQEEINKISEFYEAKEQDALKRFQKLKNIFNELLPNSKISVKINNDNNNLTKRILSSVELKNAKRKIKKAVFEFYRGVLLLKNYKVLNYTSIIKILKKYDKISMRNGSEIFVPIVNEYYFMKSKKLEILIKEVETFYVDNFEGGVRNRAMRKLRIPNNRKKTYHFISWRIGVYIGLTIPMIYYLLISNFRQFIEIPALMLLLLLGMMHLSIPLKSNVNNDHYSLILGIIYLSILFCPLPILYHDARKWMVITLGRIMLAPAFRVQFRDFFIADELNSLTYSLTAFQLLGRPFFNNMGCFATDCSTTQKFIWTPILACLPAFWRFNQCCRRYKDTNRKFPHLLNAGKYFLSIFTVWVGYGMRLTGNMTMFYVICQVLSSIFTFLWDIKMDWALFKFNSSNFLLRDELGFKNNSKHINNCIENRAIKDIHLPFNNNDDTRNDTKNINDIEIVTSQPPLPSSTFPFFRSVGTPRTHAAATRAKKRNNKNLFIVIIVLWKYGYGYIVVGASALVALWAMLPRNRWVKVVIILVLVSIFTNYVGAFKIDSPPSHKVRKKMEETIEKWDRPDISKYLGIGTIVKSEGSVRIDHQGLITEKPEHRGKRYANLQLQFGSNTFAVVIVPVDVKFGKEKFRKAFLESLNNREPSRENWTYKVAHIGHMSKANTVH
ncbi:6566_t:CDS:10 [Diversispora eburnea]|uniref:6566_t:CDS:1 n=1 Tax=Diversispora eburnea TaxID=1213867 RepID=A0A9N9ABD3_9GLOM|nr:6566_t:CDS:10 [Diversispora eburnea]